MYDININKKTISPTMMTFNNRQFACLDLVDYLSLVGKIATYKTLLEIKNKSSSSKNITTEQENLTQQIPEELINGTIESILSDDVEADSVTLDNYLATVEVKDIRKIRKQQKITQQTLAEKTGLTQSQLSRIEANPSRASFRDLKKIAAALNIELKITGDSV